MEQLRKRDRVIISLNDHKHLAINSSDENKQMDPPIEQECPNCCKH